MTHEERMRIVENHAIKLNEHFDCVLILASSFDLKAGTSMVVGGNGNYYGKRGMAVEYLAREDEKTRVDVRPEFHEDDDGELWKCGEGI